MKKIIFTGGGTAGHVTPNIAIIEEIKGNYKIEYIGSISGIEKDLIENLKIPYTGISSGKLRRYFSIENFVDIFRIIKGFFQAFKYISKSKPNLIFSKGGFVTVPVVIAGKLLGVPVIIHESDITCGLANKIAIPFSKHICYTFPETEKEFKKEKSTLTGTPIRRELFLGSKKDGLEKSGFKNNKPVLLVMGGSLGSVIINNTLRSNLDILIEIFNIIHLCGKNNLDKNIIKEGYLQFEYIENDLKDYLALSSIIISRAGANSISEFLALKKPNLLIPLSQKASRGDQILNANSFAKQGFSKVLKEEDITTEIFVKEILDLYNNKEIYIENMENSKLSIGNLKIIKIIEKYIK